MRIKGKKYLVFAAIGAVICVALSVLYARYITALLTEESQMHLSEVATQGAASVQRQIARDFDILEVLADGIISDPEISAEKKMQRIKEQANKFDLFRIGIVDLAGNAMTSDGYEFSVADRKFFQEAVQGRRFLSEPILDKVDGVTAGIVYAVPVYHKGEVVSVLFSGYELYKLTERIDISFYHESGLAFITDSDGNVLLHPVKERSGKNFIDVARAMNNGKQVEKYQSDLKKGRSGVSHFIMQEEDRFFAYAPIQDANDWYLMTSLPAAAVFERSQKVILLTVLLLAAVSVLFTLTMLYIAVTKRKANAKIVHMAYYDTLTEAANTERFKLDAQELFRLLGSERYALLNFDVKQFRYLNSDLGYGAGDKLLVHIAHCLEKFSSKNEAFARAGTDQFLFLLTKKGDSKATAQYAEKLQEAIAEWRQPTGGYYSVRTALGIYEIDSEDADILVAIEKSNLARKAAKNGAESSCANYNSAMQMKIDRDKELEKTMPAALKNGEFKLYIQPKYDLQTEKIVGGEALVRWIKPDGTLTMPGEFIPLFEQTGMIEQMDLYLLGELCRFLREKLDQGIATVPVSINQSRRYMYRPTYAEVLCEKLSQYGVSPQMIELEITENLVYTDIDKFIKILEVLHEKGFLLSLDDFGSGYSSLNVLKDLPVDIIKLDRFMLGESMNSLRGKTVVANIIRMAKELRMSVVAEGVETREQVLFLRECGCQTAQGFYYAKPLPLEEFEQKLINKEGI